MTRLLINIDVDDVDRATTFYVDALELRVGRRLAGGAIVELLGAEVPIYLLSKDAGTPPFEGATAMRDYARHWSPIHLDVVVDDLDAALAQGRLEDRDPRMGHPVVGAEQADAQGTAARLVFGCAHDRPILPRVEPGEELRVANPKLQVTNRRPYDQGSDSRGASFRNPGQGPQRVERLATPI